ncbi:hypothetical protein [Deinococcus rubellus]|uniref:hypothetical protein n=1 Tax=Deinococcus rubellus TaxID=1889240 RepID=UPI003CD06618
MSEFLAEIDAPCSHGFASNLDPALKKQLFDVAVTQGESVVEPDRVTNDRQWESVAGQLLIGQHWTTLP